MLPGILFLAYWDLTGKSVPNKIPPPSEDNWPWLLWLYNFSQTQSYITRHQSSNKFCSILNEISFHVCWRLSSFCCSTFFPLHIKISVCGGLVLGHICWLPSWVSSCRSLKMYPPPTLTQGPVTDTPLPSPTPTAAFMYTISWRLHHFVIHYNTQCSNLHLDNAADDDNLLHHQIYSLVVFDVYLLWNLFSASFDLPVIVLQSIHYVQHS